MRKILAILALTALAMGTSSSELLAHGHGGGHHGGGHHGGGHHGGGHHGGGHHGGGHHYGGGHHHGGGWHHYRYNHDYYDDWNRGDAFFGGFVGGLVGSAIVNSGSDNQNCDDGYGHVVPCRELRNTY